MSRSQKFFRVLWRINAVLILVAASAIVITLIVVIVQESALRSANQKAEKVEQPVQESVDGESLQLEDAKVMGESGVVRIDLISTTEPSGIGSKGVNRQTRNILFIEPDKPSGHWLLADNKHEISESSEVYKRPVSEDSDVLATAVIVRAADDDQSAAGRMLLFNRTGSEVVEVAKDATKIEVSALVGEDLVVIYDRKSKLVRATFDPASLSKRSEREVAVPILK